MTPQHPRSYVPYGERDTKLIEYNLHEKKVKYRSLYTGLLRSVINGALVAVIVFCAVFLPSMQITYWYYSNESRQIERCADYVEDLQAFVNEEKIDYAGSDRLSGWIIENPYVYLIVYHSDNPTPSENARMTVFSGTRINASMDRDNLVAAAIRNGFYELKLKDGSVTVAIEEFTENLYYTIFTFLSLSLSTISSVLVLANYVRLIIERIKRFESDVTIVAEINMEHEIVNEGSDEITKLSTNVEHMRQQMLKHIKSEQEAREANTELITSISHDIRTPLTVLMGYIEMMKDRGGEDPLMDSYIAATESTAMRLKQLSDDMFKYSLAFGDTQKLIKLEEYDATTLLDQLFAEHFMLMRETGYEMTLESVGDPIKEGSTMISDAQNLMRIIDNIFSNLRKYADPAYPITLTQSINAGRVIIECKNKIRTDTDGAESNGIGLKTCVRLASLVAEKFEYKQEGEFFICRLIMGIGQPCAIKDDDKTQ